MTDIEKNLLRMLQSRLTSEDVRLLETWHQAHGCSQDSDYDGCCLKALLKNFPEGWL